MVGCITDSMDMNLSKLQETVKNEETWCAVVHGVTESQTRLSDQATTILQKLFTGRGFSFFIVSL